MALQSYDKALQPSSSLVQTEDAQYRSKYSRVKKLAIDYLQAINNPDSTTAKYVSSLMRESAWDYFPGLKEAIIQKGKTLTKDSLEERINFSNFYSHPTRS